MPSTATFPYLAKATIKYKSPHKQDLAFAKGDTIRVTGIAPKTDQDDDDDDDDDDWFVGETLDGSRSGTFPGSFVQPSDEPDPAQSHKAEAAVASATIPPAAPGAIAAEMPETLSSSVVEETPTHQADSIPEAAREAAQKGETEQAGFGAPLPPRPPSPDQEEEQEDEEEVPAPQPTQTKDPITTAEASAPVTEEKPVSEPAPATQAPATASTGQDTAAPAAAAAAATTTAAAAATASPSSPTKSPPAVATKPTGMSSSFRDRLAAFNKPAESAPPPPIPKAKPGGWKRPTPASAEGKPLLPGAPAAASSAPKPVVSTAAPSEPRTTSPSTESPSGAGGAFSAADAQSSIKMSLKERMAALQRNEAAAADASPQLKPKPSVPGKIGADRRNVALQGMGLAPGAAVPARTSSAEAVKSPDEGAAPESALEQAGESTAADPAADAAPEGAAVEAVATNEVSDAPEGATEPTEALTEEEQEAERRAAIAKRMAALGARRMGGGPSPFGAPVPPTRKASTGAASVEATSSEPGITIPAEKQAVAASEESQAAAASPSAEAPVDEVPRSADTETSEEPKILAVPRRTAAPRKKKAAAQVGAPAVVKEMAPEATDADETEPSTPAANLEVGRETDVIPSNVETDAPTSEPSHAAPEATVAAVQDEAVAEPTASDEEDAAPIVPAKASEDEAAELDPEIAENQRQLEEYLRGEGFYEDSAQPATEQAAQGVDVSIASHDDATLPHNEIGPLSPAVDAEQRQETGTPKPPSRPPSTRPPVPRTSLPPPPAADEQDTLARTQSPAASLESAPVRRASLIPPVPTTSLPTQFESAADEAEDTPEEQAATAGPVLAAPRPRMAVPTEDPEDEALLAAAEAPSANEPTEPTESAEAAKVAGEEAEPQELTEEEQEAQRRANLARRMAALGGQRIGAFPGMAPPPIMGAPMPARKAVPAAAEEKEEEEEAGGEDEVEGAPVSPRGPPRGGMAIPGLTAVPGMSAQGAESDALERARSPGNASVDTPVRLASPPPVPTSPPPKPMSPPPARQLPTPGGEGAPALPPGRPASTAPMPNLDEAMRAASPANSSLGRRTSFKPPVPQGMATHSRDSSALEYESVDEAAVSPPALPVSPPPLPVSPPPRPASRAPPLPGGASVPPRRQGSSASYASAGAGGEAAVVSPGSELAALPTAPAAAPSAGTGVTVGMRQSSRDLDLMPSSRWWRHGLDPLRLPPSVAGRPDAILYADTSSRHEGGVVVHTAEIRMLFEDYSTTHIALRFQDDDVDEAYTTLTQTHNFAPAKPGVEQLVQWSGEVGVVLGRMAIEAVKGGQVGDGSPRAFVHALMSEVPNALPPVGGSLGVVVFTQVGPTVVEAVEEVRPGDVVSCAGADFKGKKGLSPYHITFGAQNSPALLVVTDVEHKKNKIRAVVQTQTKKGPAPEEVSLRLDDLKQGILKVFRIPPRSWIPDW